MSAPGAGYIYDVKFNPSGVNKVILNSFYPKGGSPAIRLSKSTNAVNWTTAVNYTVGDWAEIALSNVATTGDKKSFAIYYTYSGGVPQSGYLKEIFDLTTASNNTAAGSKVWYCVDMDNWSGANKYIIAGDEFGLYRSNDGGVTWFPL